jgi:hypothetical protein
MPPIEEVERRRIRKKTCDSTEDLVLNDYGRLKMKELWPKNVCTLIERLFKDS